MMNLVRACIFRGLIFASVWWVLTEGAVNSWSVGLPSTIVATLSSLLLLPPCSWSIRGIARFLPFFLWHSLRGGSDVAWRAFRPDLPIDPEIFDYDLRLAPGRPRVFLVKILNLLPGTLSAAVSADTMQVHALTRGKNLVTELKAVELAVARIFAISLPDDSGDAEV